MHEDLAKRSTPPSSWCGMKLSGSLGRELSRALFSLSMFVSMSIHVSRSRTKRVREIRSSTSAWEVSSNFMGLSAFARAQTRTHSTRQPTRNDPSHAHALHHEVGQKSAVMEGSGGRACAHRVNARRITRSSDRIALAKC